MLSKMAAKCYYKTTRKEKIMIDVHCHLNDEQYVGEVDQIVNNFLEAGVSKVVCASSDIKSSELAKQIADKYESVYYAVGVHPDEAKQYDEAALEKLLQNRTPKLVAVGEIGLDYFEREMIDLNGNTIHKDREMQKQVFASQIRLANKYHLPVVIHCREAYGDTLQILKETTPKYGFEFHCYSGSLEYARELIDLGGKISFTGNVTFKNSKNIQNVAANLPIETIMFETDSPYLTPVPNRGKRNEPKNVRDVLNFVADLRDMQAEELEFITDINAQSFFKFNLGL